ncbi:MAG: hypothetical protein ACOY82_16820 [Pseudomonadota bacterium]
MTELGSQVRAWVLGYACATPLAATFRRRMAMCFLFAFFLRLGQHLVDLVLTLDQLDDEVDVALAETAAMAIATSTAAASTGCGQKLEELSAKGHDILRSVHLDGKTLRLKSLALKWRGAPIRSTAELLQP